VLAVEALSVTLNKVLAQPSWLKYGSAIKSGEQRRKPAFSKDKRRAHRHYRVTVIYRDDEKFARVCTDRMKATKFAERPRESPVVKTARVIDEDA
jgi:hypothetical protein